MMGREHTEDYNVRRGWGGGADFGQSPKKKRTAEKKAINTQGGEQVFEKYDLRGST